VTSNGLLVDLTVFHIYEALLVSQFGDGDIWNAFVKCVCDAVNWMYVLHSSYYGSLTYKRFSMYKFQGFVFKLTYILSQYLIL
jgi:hypothetical protein